MNVQKIQERLDALTAPKTKKFEKIDRSITYFKPQIGKHLIRFIPYKENKENPFVELYFHYGIGPKVLLSPISYGEKDPIVEFAKTLQKSKDPEDWKLAKKLQPKMRTFALVVDRKEEEKGPRWYEFGKNVYQELLALASDEDVLDFTDIVEGRDIKVEIIQGPNYPETSVRPSMKASEATKDTPTLEKWLDEQPDLISNYKKYTFDEIKGFLEKWLDPETEEESTTTTESNNAFETSTPEVKSKPKETISEKEFDDIFGEDK